MSRDAARDRYIMGELVKVMPDDGQIKLKMLNDKAETFWLNITPEQHAAIVAVLLDNPNPALATLRDAASKWATELETYIIPNAAETDEGDAANYQQELDELNKALILLSPQRSKCFICSEPIHIAGDAWMHDHGDESCRTGDGAVAYPPETESETKP